MFKIGDKVKVYYPSETQEPSLWHNRLGEIIGTYINTEYKYRILIDNSNLVGAFKETQLKFIDLSILKELGD